MSLQKESFTLRILGMIKYFILLLSQKYDPMGKGGNLSLKILDTSDLDNAKSSLCYLTDFSCKTNT